MNHLDIFNGIDKMWHTLQNLPRTVDGNIDPSGVRDMLHVFETEVLTDLETQVQRMVSDV